MARHRGKGSPEGRALSQPGSMPDTDLCPVLPEALLGQILLPSRLCKMQPGVTACLLAWWSLRYNKVSTMGPGQALMMGVATKPLNTVMYGRAPCGQNSNRHPSPDYFLHIAQRLRSRLSRGLSPPGAGHEDCASHPAAGAMPRSADFAVIPFHLASGAQCCCHLQHAVPACCLKSSEA